MVWWRDRWKWFSSFSSSFFLCELPHVDLTASPTVKILRVICSSFKISGEIKKPKLLSTPHNQSSSMKMMNPQYLPGDDDNIFGPCSTTAASCCGGDGDIMMYKVDPRVGRGQFLAVTENKGKGISRQCGWLTTWWCTVEENLGTLGSQMQKYN